jgi:alpha-L-arabinofuranosidase
MFGSHIGTEVVPVTLEHGGPRLFASATRDEARHKLIVKVVNGTSDARTVGITLTGVEKVNHEAKLITLSGKSPNATNSIRDPEAVVPVEQRIALDGPKFERSFAAYSINVLEITY